MRAGCRFAAIAALIGAFATAADAAPPRADERASLLAVAAAADAAWDAGDAVGIADVYTPDATFVLGPGHEVAGREAIRAWFRGYFAERPAGQRLVTRIERINMLQPGMALVDGRVRVEQLQPDGTWAPLREYVNYSLALRDRDRWRLHEVRAIATAPAQRLASR
jgi:uncharacterized protein (TIGR02246 family)